MQWSSQADKSGVHGTLTGQRAAAAMSLLHSARLNGHDVHACMKDILERLPSQPASRVSDLLPHCWTPAQTPPRFIAVPSR
jgi:hypothetical protein